MKLNWIEFVNVDALSRDSGFSVLTRAAWSGSGIFLNWLAEGNLDPKATHTDESWIVTCYLVYHRGKYLEAKEIRILKQIYHVSYAYNF